MPLDFPVSLLLLYGAQRNAVLFIQFIHYLPGAYKKIRLTGKKVSLFQAVFHTLPEFFFNRFALFCQTIGLIQNYQSILILKIIQESHCIFIKVSQKMLCRRKIVKFSQAVYCVFYCTFQPCCLFCKKSLPKLLYRRFLFLLNRFDPFFQRFLIQYQFRCGINSDLIQILHRALALCIKASNRINLIPPQLDPDRVFFCKRININDSSPEGKLSRCFRLGISLISHTGQPPFQLIHIHLAGAVEMQGVLLYYLKRKQVVHTASHTGDHCHTSVFQQGSNHFHSLFSKKVSVNICLKKNQILCRIIKYIPVVQTVIFVELFCF